MVLQVWERCRAWLAVQCAVTAAGFTGVADCDVDTDTAVQPDGSLADAVALAEVAAVTGSSRHAAGVLILAGRALSGPLARTRAAVESGAVSWPVALVMVEATLPLTDEQAIQVEDRVLPRAVAPIDPVTGQGCWRGVPWARRAVQRAVIAVDPEGSRRRRERACQRRDVSMRPNPGEGTATITATLPAVEAVAVYQALQLLAEHLRARDTKTGDQSGGGESDGESDADCDAFGAGDRTDRSPRAWGQARADALVQAILDAAEHVKATGDLPKTQGKVRLEAVVVIDWPTLTRLADNPGEITGFGPIDPELTRLLTAQAGAWTRWVLDPVTGHLLDAGRTRYRPTQALRDYLLAAYPTCTYPGCGRHSVGCEIDHLIEWSNGGDTSAANLHPICWAHHRAKTSGRLTAAKDPATGQVTYRTPHGLTHTSEPPWHDWASNPTHPNDPTHPDDPTHPGDPTHPNDPTHPSDPAPF